MTKAKSKKSKIKTSLTDNVDNTTANDNSMIQNSYQTNSLADYTPQYVLDSDAKDSGRIITSKYEFDLFYKEDDIAYAVYRVKYLKSPHPHWNLMKNAKIVASLAESYFTRNEVKILHGGKGFLQLLELAKLPDINHQQALTKIKSWLKSLA